MKSTILLCSIAVISVFSNAQHSINWEPEITVADGTIYGNIRPRITVDNNGNPIVLTGKSPNGEIFVTKGDGTSFSLPTQVSPAGMETYLATWTGPDIAANGNNVIVVFKGQTYQDGNIYAVRSTDGGVTFGDTLRVDNHDVGVSWMPALDMDENGNPHVAYMIFNASGADERIAVVSSTDGGLSYNPQQVVTTSAPGVACDCCPVEMVTKGNYQLALFRNNESNIRDSWGALSTDNGTSFSSTANLNELNWLVTSCPATGPHAAIIGDSAYVVSASRASGAYRVYASTASLSGGLTLNSVHMMSPPTTGASDAQDYPRISGEGDTLVMVWEERESGNTNIMAAVTVNGSAQTLAEYKSMLNENAAGAQLKPDVYYKNGYVHAIYHDLNSGDVIYRRGTIIDVTDIQESAHTSLKMYPNPSNGSVKISGIDMSDVHTVQATDLLGKQVEIKMVNDSLKLVHPTSGMYFVKIKLFSGEELQSVLLVN